MLFLRVQTKKPAPPVYYAKKYYVAPKKHYYYQAPTPKTYYASPYGRKLMNKVSNASLCKRVLQNHENRLEQRSRMQGNAAAQYQDRLELELLLRAGINSACWWCMVMMCLLALPLRTQCQLTACRHVLPSMAKPLAAS